MKTSKTFIYAVRSLLQHKLRAALSVLGIICGVMAVLSMLSIGEGAKQEALRQIEQLGTRNIFLKATSLTTGQSLKARERLSRGLGFHDVKLIQRGGLDVRDVASLKELTAPVIGTTKDITPQIVAASSNYAKIQKLPIAQGRFISDQDIARRNLVCVIGDNVAHSLGLQRITKSQVRIGNNLFRIVGILERQNFKSDKSSVVSVRNYNDMIFIPFGTENAVNRIPENKNRSESELSEVVIQVTSSDHVSQAALAIRRIMEVSHGGVEDYQVIIPQELLRQLKKTQRTFNIVLGSIACISLLVGGIGIMNIMLATVLERTREIGIRRAVGATRKNIITQFLVESVLLTVSGGIIGIVAGTGGVWLISTMAGWKTAITPLSLILPVVMSLLVGIFFGLYPAYVAARMDPITALRHE